MAVLEALVGLVFVVGVVVIVYAALTLVPRWLRKWRYKRSIEGRIEQKEQELGEQDSYLQEITWEMGMQETSESRRQILSAYRELATLKRNQLSLELDALRAERDTREFEKRMERRTH